MYVASIRTAERSTALGQVKILQKGQTAGRPVLEKRFNELSSDYCSLGQDIEYYEKLMDLPEDLRREYLEAIRDAAFDPAIEGAFADEPGWQTSLLRFGQAVNALSAGRQLLHGNELRSDQMSFRYDWTRDGVSTPIPFEFDDSTDLPGRCRALIGYNGVGKTTLLADLALTASSGSNPRAGSRDPSVISGKDTTFGAVITIAYSAFDTFLTPEDPSAMVAEDDGQPSTDIPNAFFGYVYCGLRRRNHLELKSIEEIQSEFADALYAAGRRESGGHLIAAFETLSREPSFGQADVDLAMLGGKLTGKGAIDAFSKLSTGHKIVLNIVAQLAAHLRTRSLVLIDEPETHLHPPLVAALLRAIQVLLKAHGSFAIVATHSPVVVQELPAAYVSILQRYGNVVGLRRPEIETFAENIGTITRHVFSLDSSATDYQGVLARLSAHFTIEEIDDMFENGLSVQGRALVAGYRQQQL
jgi:predicted ATPase